MNHSDNKHGYTGVTHDVYDIVLPTLSPSAQLVFLRIYRQTVGWKKEKDRIAFSQFRKYTGYKNNHTIIKAIEELEERNLILCCRWPRAATEYSIVWKTVWEMTGDVPSWLV